MRLTRGSCGTVYGLEDGQPIEWLPGKNPIQWAAQQLDKAKVPDAALALVSAGRALQTLRLGEWAVPVGELRSGGESVSTGGQAVGEADGAGSWARSSRRAPACRRSI